MEDRTDLHVAEHKTLFMDNGGYTSANRILGTEVVELPLSGPGTGSWNSMQFWSYGGVSVSTDGAPYEYYDQWGTLHRSVELQF